MTIMDRKTDINEFFKNGKEDVYFRDSKKDNGITERFKDEFYDDVICLINVEGLELYDTDLHIKYVSKRLRKLLKKHKLFHMWVYPGSLVCLQEDEDGDFYDVEIECDINKPIKKALFDYDNIKKYYDPHEETDYPYALFNNDETLIRIHFSNWACYLDNFHKNIGAKLYYILPEVIEYAEEYSCLDLVMKWIKTGQDRYIFTTYALSWCFHNLYEYEKYMNDIYYDTTARRIAINKLKRNKIVNEGILLKLSMKNCGMF